MMRIHPYSDTHQAKNVSKAILDWLCFKFIYTSNFSRLLTCCIYWVMSASPAQLMSASPSCRLRLQQQCARSLARLRCSDNDESARGSCLQKNGSLSTASGNIDSKSKAATFLASVSATARWQLFLSSLHSPRMFSASKDDVCNFRQPMLKHLFTPTEWWEVLKDVSSKYCPTVNFFPVRLNYCI